MTKLALRHCTPIKQGTKPISRSIALSLLKQLSPNWSFSANTKELQQEFSFKNFHETMGFVNAVAWIANTEDHHPDLKIGYNHCTVCFTTHAANGLTVNDFICAAKIDAIHISATEKTRALPETRLKTEMPSQNIQLNMNEAEELLNIEIKAPEPLRQNDDDDYEIQLTDPDDEPTRPHLHNPARAGNAAENKAINTPTEDEAEVFTDQDAPAENQDFMATVILSPGSQTIHPRNNSSYDTDEDATIIESPEDGLDGGNDWNPQSPHTTANDPDEVKTMIVPGLKTADEEEEEDPDMMKTMIMKAPRFDKNGKIDPTIENDETVLIPRKSPGKK